METYGAAERAAHPAIKTKEWFQMAAKVADCENCGRALRHGDEAYETEWKKITTANGETRVTLEYRYSCAPECPKEG